MKKLFALLWVSSIYSIAWADDAKDCTNIEHYRDRTACIYGLYEKADAELNSAYKNLNDFLKEENRATLKKAQLAWLKYRDSDCELEAAAYTGGTLYNEISTSCLLKKTKNRTAELIDLKDTWNM